MLTIEELGISTDELIDRVVDRITDSVLNSTSVDEDGEPWSRDSAFRKKLEDLVIKKIDTTVTAIADKQVLPQVAEIINGLTLSETNKWGEKKKEPLTFIEYLEQRASHYLSEKVDFNGKSKEESNGYSWSGTQTRLTHMVHSHLHYSVESAMKSSLNAVTGSLTESIAETAKIKLNEMAKTMSLTFKTGK